jgi:curved DNA-binding protein CbpA
MMTEDPYRTLGIPEDATTDQVHRAYRMLAMRYHPDRNQLPQAASLMAGINQAYEVLSKPAKRAAYDRQFRRRESPLDDVFLIAARTSLVKQGWTLLTESSTDLIMRNGSRRVEITLVPEVDSALLIRLARRSQCFAVVLGLRFVPPVSLPSEAFAVIDLMHSRLYAGNFPDSTYRDLFKALL